MVRRILIAFAFLAWLAGNLLYFFWYQELSSLDFTPSAAAITAVFVGWIFAGAYFFPRRGVRVALGTVYSVLLAWSLVNFAYYRIFGTYLPVFSSRLRSVNLPMLRLVSEFAGQIPWTLALAALGLIAAYLVVCFLSRAPQPDQARLVFAADRRSVRADSWRARFRKLSIALGLALQAGAFFAATDLIKAANSSPVDNFDQTATLQAVGPVGYALSVTATMRSGTVEETSAPRPDRTIVASLQPSQADAETVRRSLDALGADAASAHNQLRPEPPRVPHVIVYQLESAASWALEQDPSPMPFLSALIGRYGTVENHFASGCTTIDAEFVANCGFLPETYGPVSDLYSKNGYNCLPGILKEQGYGTYLYHADDAAFWSRDSLGPAWGFEHLVFKPELGYRQPDSRTLDRVVEDLRAAKGPTYQYVIGFTGHAPHDRHFINFYKDNYATEIKPYSGEIDQTAKLVKADEATVRNYLGFLRSADDGLRRLFDRLASEGLDKNTLVVVVGDHRYYQSTDLDPQANFLAYNRVPLVIAAPGADPASWPKIASHLDIAPTLYDYLTQGQGTLPATFLGTSLYSPAHRDAAAGKCLGRASFYDGNKLVETAVAQSSSQVRYFNGASGDDAAKSELGRELMSVATVTDLMLARDAIGKTAGGNSNAVNADANTDSDHDGLSNLRETALGTDKDNPDTDGDGYSDGEEVMNGYNPLGPGKKLLETVAQ